MKNFNLITAIGILFLVSCQSNETNKYITNLNSSEKAKRLDAITMLGSIKGPKAVEALVNLALSDVEQEERVRAVQALGEIRDPTAVGPLNDILIGKCNYKNGILDTNYKVEISDNDEFRWLRSSAADALGLVGDSTIIKSLILVAIFDNANSVSTSARNALVSIGNKSIVESSWAYYNYKDSIIIIRLFDILKGLHYPLSINCLQEAFRNNNSNLRLSAVEYSMMFKNPLILNDLIYMLDDPDFNIKIAAIEAIGELREQKAITSLIEIYKENNLHLKMAVIDALVKLRGSQSIEFLFKIIRNNNQTEKYLAFDALGRMGEPSVIQQLLELYDSDSWEIRDGAIKALGKYLNNEIVNNLIIEALSDTNFTIRRSAAEVLKEAGKHDALMTAFESKNLVVIACLYEYFWAQTLSISGRDELFIMALNKYGDVPMANFFLNTNSELQDAATAWGEYRGYKVVFKGSPPYLNK